MNRIAELRYLPKHVWRIIDGKILTAEDFYQPQVNTTGVYVPLNVRGCQRCIACFPPPDLEWLDGLLPSRGKTVDEPRAVARIERGKWIADCPFDCGQAQVVSETDHFYLCNQCLNEQVGGAFVPCVWPHPEIRNLIEETLLKRPSFITRNWHVPETVKNLRDENYVYLGIK